MSAAKREAKRERRLRREANMRRLRVSPPLPPAERTEITEDIERQIALTDNVRNIPLALLKIHECHGDRNPYLDTPDGKKRRQRCEGHIRDAGGFDLAACEVLTISVHRDGTHWIINGVGRLYMADVLSGGLVTALPCKLLFGLTPSQERTLFERMGTQNTKISPYDVWRSKISARGEEGDEVRAIVALRGQFGRNMPRVTLPVLRFGNAMLSPKDGKPVLERALALVVNTSLGANRKLTSMMTSATIALLGTNANFDEERFRAVIGTDDEFFSQRLFERALKKANKLGFLRPHARTTAWVIAGLIAEEYYNLRIGADRKLDTSALDDLRHGDAYSSQDPPKLAPKTFKAGTTDGSKVNGVVAELRTET